MQLFDRNRQGANPDGTFKDHDSPNSIIGTMINGGIFNQLGEELNTVIKSGGLTPDSNTLNQLDTSIKKQIKNAVDPVIESVNVVKNASGVAYNNGTSKLEAVTVQGAIDEIVASSGYNFHTIQPRNLKDVFGTRDAKSTFLKLREKSSKGDFTDLRIGDYIDLDSFSDGEGSYTWNAGQQNLRCQIVAFDHYYRVGDQDNTTHHVVMQFKNCYRQKRMHSSDANSGGYNGKELQTFLNGNVKNGLVSAIGITPVKVRRLLDGYNTWTWVEEYVFLPTEVEVIGHQAWGHSYNNAYSGYQTGTSIQYPIFTIAPQSRIKFYNGSRQWWGVASPCYTYAGYFVFVSYYGDISYASASNTGCGVAPAFCI